MLPLLLPLLTQRQQWQQHGVAVCRCRGGDVATTVVDFDFVFVLFWFWFLLLHADGVVVSPLFPAADIGVSASSVTAAVVLGAVIPRVETKMVPMKATVATTNETPHRTPSTLLSDSHPREGKGKGKDDDGEGGGRRRGRRW